MARKPTVWVTDDDDDVRDALVLLLRAHHLHAVPCASGPALLGQLSPDAPGCIILDVRMPGMGGLEVQQELHRRHLPQPVIFLTGHGDVPLAVRALRARAFHFLEKPVNERELLGAVREAIRDDAVIRRRDRERARAVRLVATLSPREAQVARLVAEGLRTAEIAARLELSPRTVDMHRARLRRRLGARTSAEAARLVLHAEAEPAAPA